MMFPFPPLAFPSPPSSACFVPSFDPQDGELEVTSDFDKAPVEVLARVHSNDYLQFVTDLAKQMTAIAGPGQKQMEPVPFTPQVGWV